MNENLKMSAALLSRFDLVFILLDKPDELLDKRVSEHIMSVSDLSGDFVFLHAFDESYPSHNSIMDWKSRLCSKSKSEN